MAAIIWTVILLYATYWYVTPPHWGQLQCCSRIELAESRGWWSGCGSEAVVQNRFQRAHNNNKVHKKMHRFIPLPLRPLYLLTLWDPLSCLTVRTTNSTRFAFSFWHHESNLTMCSVRFMWPTIRFSTTLEVALGYYSSQSITSHSACSINSEEKATN